jgi:hypothetical protein
MKKVGFLMIMAGFLAACSNSEPVKVDLSKAGKKFDSSAGRIWDSTKREAKELGEKIKDKVKK